MGSLKPRAGPKSRIVEKDAENVLNLRQVKVAALYSLSEMSSMKKKMKVVEKEPELVEDNDDIKIISEIEDKKPMSKGISPHNMVMAGIMKQVEEFSENKCCEKGGRARQRKRNC